MLVPMREIILSPERACAQRPQRAVRTPKKPAICRPPRGLSLQGDTKEATPSGYTSSPIPSGRLISQKGEVSFPWTIFDSEVQKQYVFSMVQTQGQNCNNL